MHTLRLIATFFRLGISNELQYRANFFVNLLQTGLSLLVSLAGLALVFDHTDSLGGWSPAELLALVGIYYIVGGVINTFIQPSLELFLQDVRKGTLDFTLTKPVDAQLLVSIRKISIWSLLDVALGVAIIAIALARLAEQISLTQVLGFAFMLATGIVIVYSFWLMLATIAFWFIKIENILVIFQSMYQAGRWPVGIYPPFLRILLTFLVPVAFAVTVPAEALVGRLTPALFVQAIAMAVALFWLSRWFWKVGTRHYSGASA